MACRAVLVIGMGKKLAFVASLLFTSVLLAQSTRPSATTQPTPLVKPIRSLEVLIAKLPADDRPEDGKPWNALLYKAATSWAQGNLIGTKIRIPMFLGADPTPNGDGADAVFFYSGYTDSSGKDWPRGFTKFGYLWCTGGIRAKFNASSVGKLSRLQPWSNDYHRGDRPTITGTLDKVFIDSSVSSVGDVRISLSFKDCDIVD
jgi:hypothetical protein